MDAGSAAALSVVVFENIAVQIVASSPARAPPVLTSSPTINCSVLIDDGVLEVRSLVTAHLPLFALPLGNVSNISATAPTSVDKSKQTANSGCECRVILDTPSGIIALSGETATVRALRKLLLLKRAKQAMSQQSFTNGAASQPPNLPFATARAM